MLCKSLYEPLFLFHWMVITENIQYKCRITWPVGTFQRTISDIDITEKLFIGGWKQ